MNELPARLAAAMRAAGLNQPKLAKAASTPKAPVSQQSVHQLISGRNSNSRHLAAIAEALGVSLDWLATGRSGKGAKRSAEALLIGKVEGDEIRRFVEGPMLWGIESPSGTNSPNVVQAGDKPCLPLREGWLVFYGPEHQGIPEECLDKFCVVQVKDGPTLLKTLKQGSRKGLFRLEGWQTPARLDLKLAWAARVTDIMPR